MKNLILKICRWGLTLIGLGFVSGCEKAPDDLPLDYPAAYGSPYATFEIKGRVVDEDTGKPVKGVSLIRGHVSYHGKDAYGNYIKEYHPIPYSRMQINDDGTFEVNGQSSGDKIIPVFLSDDDPSADGNYRDSLYLVEAEPDKGFKTDDFWHTGHYKAEDVIIKAKKTE